MFNNVKMERVKKLLQVDDESAEFIIKNQAKYLKINPEKFLNSFIVAYEESQRYNDRMAKKLKSQSKNILIMKYKDEIVDMYCNKGFGYLKISRAIKLNHNSKISKSAIENFVKRNKLIKGSING